MSGESNRLDLLIDILDLKEQRANVVGELRPSDLIKAALNEFAGDLPHLGQSVNAYHFVRAENRSELNNDESLGTQVENNAHLVLTEWVAPTPDGAQAVDRALYLSDESAGEVYKLSWFPAIIGRPDKSRPENEFVAVNLEAHRYAQRVSRRHAKITREGDQVWIESLSSNATELIRNDEAIPVTDEKQVLEMNDVIRLKRSKILLRVMGSND